MKNEIMAFRSLLADMGTEMTPEQASRAYKASRRLIKRSRSMSMKDLWDIQEMEDVPAMDREQILELYRGAKEL